VSVRWATKGGRALWNDRLLADLVPELVDQVVALLDPEVAWLYGSVARGDDDGKPRHRPPRVLPPFDPARTTDMKRRVHSSITTPVPFDVAFTAPDRFSQRARVPGSLERAAVREGRRVYERT
jgi:ribosomal protein L34